MVTARFSEACLASTSLLLRMSSSTLAQIAMHASVASTDTIIKARGETCHNLEPSRCRITSAPFPALKAGGTRELLPESLLNSRLSGMRLMSGFGKPGFVQNTQEFRQKTAG